MRRIVTLGYFKLVGAAVVACVDAKSVRFVHLTVYELLDAFIDRRNTLAGIKNLICTNKHKLTLLRTVLRRQPFNFLTSYPASFKQHQDLGKTRLTYFIVVILAIIDGLCKCLSGFSVSVLHFEDLSFEVVCFLL